MYADRLLAVKAVSNTKPKSMSTIAVLIHKVTICKPPRWRDVLRRFLIVKRMYYANFRANVSNFFYVLLWFNDY